MLSFFGFGSAGAIGDDPDWTLRFCGVRVGRGWLGLGGVPPSPVVPPPGRLEKLHDDDDPLWYMFGRPLPSCRPRLSRETTLARQTMDMALSFPWLIGATVVSWRSGISRCDRVEKADHAS